MEGALDSQIVAATVRKLAKLSSEAKESEKSENRWKLHMPLLLVQKVTNMHIESYVAIILVLIRVD